MAARFQAAFVLLLAGRAAALPPGFTRTLMADDAGAVTSLAPLADGRIIAGDYYGGVALIRPGQTSVALLQIADTWYGDDHGLLGIVADPQFAANGWFYVFYSANGPYDRVVRYTLSGESVDPASRTLIW